MAPISCSFGDVNIIFSDLSFSEFFGLCIYSCELGTVFVEDLSNFIRSHVLNLGVRLYFQEGSF